MNGNKNPAGANGGGKAENAGSAFKPQYRPCGSVRQILGALADLASERAEADPSPARRQRHRKLARYLTQRLARRVMAEVRR